MDSWSNNMNIHICIFYWFIFWRWHITTNIYSILQLFKWKYLVFPTQLFWFVNSDFWQMYLKNNLNKWNIFQVRAHCNSLFRPTYQVIKILDQLFIIQWIKINIWNISANIDVGNYEKVVVPLGKIANTECLLYSPVNYKMHPK